MKKLLLEIRSCNICKKVLPNTPRPVLQAGTNAKILIIGQAPGQKVQNSGIPWDDQSGNELRRWFGVEKEQFYDEKIFALVPMGFCYPGKSSNGDLPPRPECAPLWHTSLLKKMKNIKLTILIGRYAQKYYLGNSLKPTLTETVKNYQEYFPQFLPLVHPSPRNKIWQKKNAWFEEDVIPQVQKIIKEILSKTED